MKTVKDFKEAHLIFVRGDYHGCGRSLIYSGANWHHLADNQVVTHLAWRETEGVNPEFTGRVQIARHDGQLMWRPTL